MDRMKFLIQQLQKASKAYYHDNIEIMSNYEYDSLYDELEALEKLTGIQLSNSPTLKIGHDVVEGLEKVNHEVPLLSLDKTKEPAKLANFLGEHSGLISWKLDGLTVVLTYEDGLLSRAVTRGNGILGEDVTHNAKFFVNIPLTIPYKNRLLIRGEAVITYDDFEAINASIIDADSHYKNPRNLCSGTVRQLDSQALADRPVMFYAFANLLQIDGLKSDQLEFLSNLGFDVVKYSLVTANTVEDEVNIFRNNLPDLGIPTDGLVVTYDDMNYSLSLGTTSKFPKDAIAFKWADELAETTLRHVEWNTSRTGLINPIAVFDPVELEGTTVNKAGLHNVSILRQLALGEGDKITVYKANMIIPQVAENLTRSDTIQLPKICPTCHSPTEILKQKEGEALFCSNNNCGAQQLGALVHFCSRDAMNIEGLSEQTLEKWIEHGFISNYTDIFALANYRDEIIKMEGFGEKSFTKLMASIEAAKDVDLANFIFALGIKHVGLSNAKLLCRQFSNLDEIIKKSEDGQNLVDIKGFGKAIAQSLQDYFSNDDNVLLIKKAEGILRIKAVEKHTGQLDGLTFVITGSVNHFTNRKALQNYIEEKGGKCTGTVSANTSYLINNDSLSASAKNKKAQSLGVKIITEEMFLELFKDGEANV